MTMSRHPAPKRKNGSLLWFLVPIGAYLAIFFLAPLVYDLYISLFDYKLGGLATYVGLKNYRQLLDDSQYVGSLFTTVIYTATVVSVELALGLFIALLLKKESKVMDAIRTVILIPTVFTPLVAGLVWKALYHPDLGMITYYLRAIGLDIGRGLTVERSTALLAVMIVDIWEWTPLVVIVLLAGIKGLPIDPFEAATIDGASPARTLFQITLPLLRPTIVVALLIRSLDALKAFDTIWAITGGGPGTTTTVANLRIYEVGMQNLKIGYAAALSNVLMLVGIVMGCVFVRSLYVKKES
jgi:multiple sugar transport system permease protein